MSFVKRTFISIFFLIIMFFIYNPSLKASDNLLHFNMGMDLVISPDYNDTIKDAYSEYELSGGYGWLGLLMGVKYDLSSQLYLYGNAELFFNLVSSDEDTYFNTMIVPSLKLLYKFQPGNSFYVSGEVNINSPNSGGDRIEFESGGLGYGGFLGYSLGEKTCIEIGYLYIPVEVTYGSYAEYYSYYGYSYLYEEVKDEVNFGGGLIRAMFAF